MTAEKETLRRVQDGLFHLQKGLAPFVEANMKKVHGRGWLQYASRAQGGAPNASLDAYGLLKTLIDRWRKVFEPMFERNTGQKVRTLASTALEGRNVIAHSALALTDAEALRYLDAMLEVLRTVKAPAAEIDELKRLYDQQRLSGVTVAPMPAPTPAAAPTPKPDRRGWIGHKVPSATMYYLSAEGLKTITTEELFSTGKKVVVFAVPGAFTPTCSAKHVPSYVRNFDLLKTKGVDTIACVSVNDAFVMAAWGKDQECDYKVMMLADGNGEFTEKMGLVMDGTKFGLSKRSQRYAMVVNNEIIKALYVEKPGAFEVSSAESVLKDL